MYTDSTGRNVTKCGRHITKFWVWKCGGGAQTYLCPPLWKVGGGHMPPLPPPPVPTPVLTGLESRDLRRAQRAAIAMSGTHGDPHINMAPTGTAECWQVSEWVSGGLTPCRQLRPSSRREHVRTSNYSTVKLSNIQTINSNYQTKTC